MLCTRHSSQQQTHASLQNAASATHQGFCIIHVVLHFINARRACFALQYFHLCLLLSVKWLTPGNCALLPLLDIMYGVFSNFLSHSVTVIMAPYVSLDLLGISN